MTTTSIPCDRSASWLKRVLKQYALAASMRTISGARSRHSRRALRAYFSTLSLLFVLVAGACSDAGAPIDPTPQPPAVAAVQVAPEAVQLAVGEVRQLTGSARDAQGNALSRTLAWRSSDAAIASVDAAGNVRGVAGGRATITASVDGREGSAVVDIQAIPVELDVSRAAVTFAGIAGATSPEPLTVSVTAKHGVASGLVADVAYGTGSTPGWLAATLSATTTPATLTLTALTGALQPGSYTARVDLHSPAQPHIVTRSIDVLFTVAAGPQLDISATDRHNCALDLAGRLFCWGYNASRQLGTGSLAEFETRPMLLPGRQYMSISTGELHACAIAPDAKAYCWGNGFMGDGQGAVIGVAPRPVSGDLGWARLAAGYRHTCGITVQGETYCWGTNNGGQLGNGTRVSQSQPVKVSAGLTFVAITAGEEHTCALTANGDAYCWGRAAYGRLGMNVTSTDALVTPTKVPGDVAWATIDAGRYHTCAVDRTGVAYCWGYNGNGQLGDDSRTSRSAPTALASNVRFSTISAGNAHSCAVATSGAAYCWGLRSPGAVGDGITDGYALAPTRVAGNTSFQRITAANAHTCAVSTAHEAFCWGNNRNGAIGDGTTTDSNSPVLIRFN